MATNNAAAERRHTTTIRIPMDLARCLLLDSLYSRRTINDIVQEAIENHYNISRKETNND